MKKLIVLALLTGTLHAGCSLTSFNADGTRNCLLKEQNQMKTTEIKLLKEQNKLLQQIVDELRKANR